MSTGVTYPGGFRAAGISADLKPSGSPDLGLLLRDAGTTAAGLFTTNAAVAAPVVLAAADAMAGPEVSLRISVGHGPGTARVLGGDLSYGYVRINGEYTT